MSIFYFVWNRPHSEFLLAVLAECSLRGLLLAVGRSAIFVSEFYSRERVLFSRASSTSASEFYFPREVEGLEGRLEGLWPSMGPLDLAKHHKICFGINA